MLKTNEQLLQEKIEYATDKIKQYEARIELLNEAILENKRILDSILMMRMNKKITFDIANNRTITSSAVNNAEAKYEQALKQENLEYTEEIEKLEDKIKELQKTKNNLTSILNKTKKSPAREK